MIHVMTWSLFVGIYSSYQRLMKKEENYRLLDLLFVFLLDFLPAERFLFLDAAFLAFSAVFRFLVRAAFLAVARRCAFVCAMFRMNCT